MPLPRRRSSTAARTSASGARSPTSIASFLASSAYLTGTDIGSRSSENVTSSTTYLPGRPRHGRRLRPLRRAGPAIGMRQGGALEQAGPVAEAALAAAHRDDGACRPVEHRHRRDRRRYLLAVGADVLDRRRARQARDSRQALDPGELLRDRPLDEAIPVLASGDGDQRPARPSPGRPGRWSRPAGTVPGKPSSQTTRLLPPPSTSSGLPDASTCAHGRDRGRQPSAPRRTAPQDRRAATWCSRTAAPAR